MAALVKLSLANWKSTHQVTYAGPVKVAEAVDTDLSTPDTSIEFDTKGVRLVVWELVVANYTSVTVKWQRKVGSAYADLAGTSQSTDGVFDFVPDAPSCRLSIAGTLSASADTLDVYVYMEKGRPGW